MVNSEGVLEVEDGENETDKLAKGDCEGDDQRGALCGHDEHPSYAYILGDTVSNEVHPELWNQQKAQRYRLFKIRLQRNAEGRVKKSR